MKYQKLRGTEDIISPQIELWQEIESISRDLFEVSGYKEIKTPIVEFLQLFQRSIGKNTDIVEKEIFQFQDRSERKIALRPEATASIVRAYLECGLYQNPGLTKLYYIGPMFRAERPQKGRKRQFYQVGIEAIGSLNPEIDAEVIWLVKKLLDNLGVDDFRIEINSLGCDDDKIKIVDYLKGEISKNLDHFCQNCQNRFERNVLRVLDCKNPDCKSCLKNLKIDIKTVICKNCMQHYNEVKSLLTVLGVQYEENKYLVRGLDYYTRTVFEVLNYNLGAQNVICAGGRYDNLVEEMGGKPTGAVGFALGMERIAMLLEDRSKKKIELDIFLILQDRMFLKEALKELINLRENGIYAEMDYQSRSLKSQMRLANEKKARYVLILGQKEWEKGEFCLKDMKTGSQINIKKEKLLEVINRII
ncbi:MAG: histidine--tRNA ligase [Candidatus Saelkia tenebricola]|nr:histidine--tRNA ligase [Candidatus Saelkia tenebricola]